MLFDQSGELQTRKVLQQLIEQARDLYHGGALLGGDQRCVSNIILGDRACLALGILLRAPVYTADKDWKTLKLGIPIHILR